MNLVITVPVQTKACKVEQEKHSPKQKLSTLATPTSKNSNYRNNQEDRKKPQNNRSQPVQPIITVDEDFK